jgi:hypothetical protein
VRWLLASEGSVAARAVYASAGRRIEVAASAAGVVGAVDAVVRPPVATLDDHAITELRRLLTAGRARQSLLSSDPGTISLLPHSRSPTTGATVQRLTENQARGISA